MGTDECKTAQEVTDLFDTPFIPTDDDPGRNTSKQPLPKMIALGCFHTTRQARYCWEFEMTDTSSIENWLIKIDKQRNTIYELGQRMMAADNCNMYPLDLFAMGTINRVVMVSAGFRTLVRASNYTCAAALLRMQLDSSLRFFATRLVKDPHELAGKVISGEHIGKQKDINGARMTDQYLVKELTKSIPWVSDVYKKTSGFIHLSESHMFAPVTDVIDDKREVHLMISEIDHRAQTTDWIELATCFYATNKIFSALLEGWIDHKDSIHKSPRTD